MITFSCICGDRGFKVAITRRLARSKSLRPNLIRMALDYCARGGIDPKNAIFRIEEHTSHTTSLLEFNLPKELQ